MEKNLLCFNKLILLSERIQSERVDCTKLTLKKTWHDYYTKQEPSISLIRFASTIIYHFVYFYAIMKRRPQKILEVGCGRGIASIFLSYFVPSCIGIDVDSEMIEIAKIQKGKFHGKAKFRVMDGNRTSFKNDTFDIVYSQGLLEHYSNEEMKNLLSEWLRLAPTCIISVPSIFYGRKDFGNERLLTAHEYKKILREFGFNASYYGFSFEEKKLSFSNLLDVYKTFFPQNYSCQLLLIIERKN